MCALMRGAWNGGYVKKTKQIGREDKQINSKLATESKQVTDTGWFQREPHPEAAVSLRKMVTFVT